MAESGEGNNLRRADFRLCRLCIWPNYDGLGFNLENTTPPPHIVQTVESNSPAAAGGLKILDFILAVNDQDVSVADYKTVTQAIINARDSNGRVELLVIEKRFYELLKLRGVSFNPALARIIDTPTAMPRDYMNFPKYTPRTCKIRLSKIDESFGFEVVNGNRDIGAFIQEVFPNTPASRTTLCKSDRILEIDDKFVDDKTSRAILNKLSKAKQKRSVKLYVVDTNTYKYFQEYRIPLTSKKFRKTKFAKQLVGYQRPNTSESVTTPESHQDDIRLCTINRANATDRYGIELNFHKRDHYHSIKMTTDRDNAPSNAALAGVKNNDHLIEINGENIENMGDEQVKQRIRTIKYPQPLQILVADSATYNYYKQQNKVIHSGLPSVKKLPANIIDGFASITSSHQEPSIPVEEPSPSITRLENNNPTQPRMSLENSQSNRRNYKLYRIPGFAGYGFSVSSKQEGNISHKITQIAPHSPAAQQGLRVGDYILTVNDKNVEKISVFDFIHFLRTSAQNTEAHGNPLLLQVINEDSYQPLAVPDDVSTQHSMTDSPSIIPSINANFIRQSSYYNPIEPMCFRNESRKSSGTQPISSRNENRISLTSKEFRKSKLAKQQQPPKSTHINVEDISTEPRTHIAKSREHRQKTPALSENIHLSESVLNGTYQRDYTEHVSTKQQQGLNLDPNNNCRRLKTEKSQVLIDTKPVQKFIQNQNVHENDDNNTQLNSKCIDVSIERNRNTTVKKENDLVYYSDDWDSDHSDDRKLYSHDKLKAAAIRRPSLSKSKTSNNVINLVPSDPTAFEASFCRKRQEVIDNMTYRQAINGWKAKRLHDVVKLIIDLSKGKSLIDRAWIVFYWVSQNIEYDVEAFFSGNIRHQTAEDVFASGKGVCDAFGTIFETLCNAVQIECKKVSGYAKGYSCKIGQKSFARTNHAWNVIRLEGHWYLVDPTWGEGFLDSNNCNRRELNPFYFLVRPEQMIYRHLPEDPKWQLLLSPISMDDFVRLPYVYPAFFEHNLDIIYPRHSNTASFNSNLGLAEVLVQTPSDTVLMGDIERTESGKIRNGSLVQYDAKRQQWQCLFVPQQGGFHTLTIFASRKKQSIKSKTDDKKYSCAIKFDLHVPTDVIKAKSFPITYGLFTERKCQIFEPLDGVLKSGSKVTIHCRVPGAYCARLKLDGNWLSEDLIKDEIFKRHITVPKQEVKIYVQFSDKRNSSSYDGLFCYSVK